MYVLYKRRIYLAVCVLPGCAPVLSSLITPNKRITRVLRAR